MRKSMLILVTASLLLTGCSLSTDKQTPTTPPPTQNEKPGTGGQSGNGGGNNTQNPPPSDPKTEAKSDKQVQDEIKEKLARMTQPKGYMLEYSSDGTVKGVKTLDDVAEQLRKKGYAPDIAKNLAKSFYKVESGNVKLVATEGWPGVFEDNKPATFTKKNKWTWTIEQKHPEDGLYEPHTAHYEVEVLKDGTYRLNVWTTKKL